MINHHTKLIKLLRLVSISIVLLLILPNLINADKVGDNVLTGIVTTNLAISDWENGEVTISMDLENTSDDRFLREIFMTLPIARANNIVATRGPDRLKVEYIGEEKHGSKVRLDTTLIKFAPGDNNVIKIKYDVRDFLDETNGIRSFIHRTPEYNFDLKETNFKISYPKSMGEIRYITTGDYTYQELEDKLVYKIDDSNNFLVSWDNYLNYKFNANYTVRSKSEGEYLVSIPIETNNQAIEWKNIDNAVNGYIDLQNNQYLSYRLGNDELVDVRYEGIISVDFSENPTAEAFGSVNHVPIRISFDEVEKGDSMEGLNKAFDLVLDAYEPEAFTGIDLDEYSKLDFNINDSVTASASEYCYALGEFAMQRDIPFRYVFGLQVAPIHPIMRSQDPHVWCEFLVNDEVIVIDPYLSDLTNVRLIDKVRFGKIFFGYFNYYNLVNPIYDLLSGNEQIMPSISIVEEGPSPRITPPVVFSSTYPKEIRAADINKYEFIIRSDSTKTLPVQNMYLDGNNISEIMHRELRPMLLPLNDNYISFQYSIEPNLIYSGQKVANLEIQFSELPPLVEDVSVYINPNREELAKWMVAFGVMTFLLFYLTIVLYNYRLSKTKF